MSESTKMVLRELGQFFKCTSPQYLHRPAAALEHIRGMVARACSEMPDDSSNSLLPLSIGLENIATEARITRSQGIYGIASITGFELGVTVSTVLLHEPEWETFLGGAVTLTMMALTQPGLDWKVNRGIRGSLENLLAIASFADLVALVQPESSQGNAAYELPGDVAASGL